MIVSGTHRLGLHRKGPTGLGQCFSETHRQTSESHVEARLHTPHTRTNVMTYEGILSAAEDEWWAVRSCCGLRGIFIMAAGGSQGHRPCAD